MSDLTITDRLLLAAADAGDLEVRESRGYDEDSKPEGWPVTVWRGVLAHCDDDGRIGSLQRDGLLTDPDSGLIAVTAAGRAEMAR